MQDGRKAVWSIPYVSVAFFLVLNRPFYCISFFKMSSRPDCIFEIHQLWQSGFSRVYSNCCCSCSFEPEILKIDQSSHKMYSNNILNFQESTLILKANMKKVWKLIECTTCNDFFFTFISYNNCIFLFHLFVLECHHIYHGHKRILQCSLKTSLGNWVFLMLMFSPE